MDKDEDALALQIGRVARAHVDLDSALRDLFRTLAYPSPAVYLADGITSTNRLVADCRLMLSRTSIEPELLDAGLDALSAAMVFNQERNRVVHDMWLPEVRFDSDAAARWEVLRLQKVNSTSSSTKPVSRDLVSVESVLTALKRVSLRISGLDTALWMTMPHLNEGEVTASWGGVPLVIWVALATDDFDLLGDGSFRVTGHEPMGLLVIRDDDE